MQAAAAERLSDQDYRADFPSQEEYAHSLSTIRRMGEAAVRGTLDVEARRGLENLAYDDFVTAVTEMLKTDAEFRDRLDIENPIIFDIIDGKACAKDGTPMVEILQNGLENGRKTLQFDESYSHQVVRDEHDLANALRVDNLQPGQVLWGLSMDPKTAMAAHPERYKALGYREGLAYVQVYYRADADTLIASSISVDKSDATAWREVLAGFGMDVPTSATPDDWLAHAVVQATTPDEAAKLAGRVRSAYYQRIGATGDRLSVSEFVAQREAKVRAMFEYYYQALSQAVYSGRNNQVMQSFASTMLGAQIEQLKPEVRRNLMQVANSQRFDPAQGKTIDSLVRYAVVEELRKDLPAMFAKNEVQHLQFNARQNHQMFISPQQIHAMTVQNIQRGVIAGRSYGGCAGNIELAASRERDERSRDGYDPLLDGVQNPQEAFGGKKTTEDRIGKKSISECVVPDCPTRPGKVMVGGCGVCLGRCQKLFDAGKDPTKMGGAPAPSVPAEKADRVAEVFELFKAKEADEPVVKPDLEPAVAT